MELKKRMERQESIVSMDDYCLDRLFDPEELYYTPMDELLKRYKTRNLRPARMYNLARRYGHVDPSRKRFIIAPLIDRTKMYGDLKVNQTNSTCSALNEVKSFDQTKKNQVAVVNYKEDEEGKSERHKSWLENRKQLRNGLNNLDLNPQYLRRKKNLNECEIRVLKQLEINTNIEPDCSEMINNKLNQDEISTKVCLENIENENLEKCTTKLPSIRWNRDDNLTFKKMNLEDKKDQLFDNSFNCYKKASSLGIVDDKVLKKALIFPEEVRSTSIVESLKEKANEEKYKKKMERYLLKRKSMKTLRYN